MRTQPVAVEVWSSAMPTELWFGSMEIIGGSFSTFGSAGADVVGNNKVGSLTVSGDGSFIGSGSRNRPRAQLFRRNKHPHHQRQRERNPHHIADAGATAIVDLNGER